MEKRIRVSDPAGDVFVDKVYSVCECLGKTARVSRPYRTGDPIYWTESRYDALGRPTQLIPPDGTETSNYLFYDYSQRNVTVTDPAGKKRKYGYDLLGRISIVYEPDASNNLTLQTAYSYPPNEMSIIQGAQMRTFLFDYLGRLTSETHPENGTTTYVYDNNGNRTQKTDARGIVTTTTYDQLNRPTQGTYSDGTPTVTWAYDTGSLRKGRLYTVTNATAASTFTYNKMGEVLREDKAMEGIPFSLIRSYNLAGAQTSMTVPNGKKISNAYNSAGQLTQITSDWVDANHPAILATGFEYAPSGALTYLEYGNGTASSRSYNSSGQLKTLQHGTLGDPGGFLDYRYHYNEGTANNGQIVSIDDFNETTKSFTYTYDTLGRLKTAATTGTHWGLSWTYDRYGNRLTQSVTKGSAPSQSLSVSTTTNRVTTWTYAAAGNTLNDGQHSYTYDANNMITQLDAGAAVYKYDGRGNRVVKQTATETIYYFFGVAEYSGGTWRKLYFFGGGAKLAEYSNGTTYFFHTDHLGTPKSQTSISGSVVETWSNFPFGEQWIASGGIGNEHRFTGHKRDPGSGNDSAGARDYSSSQGRWLSVDPVLGGLYDPQRLNRYPYVLGDPVNFVDRNGLFPCLVGSEQLNCEITVYGPLSPIVVGAATAKFLEEPQELVKIFQKPGPIGAGGGPAWEKSVFFIAKWDACAKASGALPEPFNLDLSEILRKHTLEALKMGHLFSSLLASHNPSVSLGVYDPRALGWFADQVGETQRWDLKNQSWFKEMSGLEGRELEAFGNFYYGLVAAGFGYSEAFAKMSAGLNQIYRDLLRGRRLSGSGIPGMMPYGDQIPDYVNIGKGFDFFAYMVDCLGR